MALRKIKKLLLCKGNATKYDTDETTDYGKFSTGHKHIPLVTIDKELKLFHQIDIENPKITIQANEGKIADENTEVCRFNNDDREICENSAINAAEACDPETVASCESSCDIEVITGKIKKRKGIKKMIKSVKKFASRLTKPIRKLVKRNKNNDEAIDNETTLKMHCEEKISGENENADNTVLKICNNEEKLENTIMHDELKGTDKCSEIKVSKGVVGEGVKINKKSEFSSDEVTIWIWFIKTSRGINVTMTIGKTMVEFISQLVLFIGMIVYLVRLSTRWRRQHSKISF